MFNVEYRKAWLAVGLIPMLLMPGVNAIAAQGNKNYVEAGNVGVSWKIDRFLGNYSGDGLLNNLAFRFTVNNETLHAKGTYFAQQFYFSNQGQKDGVAYTGLQPQPDKDGNQYLRAVFSAFIAGTKTTDKNCRAGADGGPGVSCGVLFPATYGHTYKILVHKVAGHKWSAGVEDQKTGRNVHIGSWTLPDQMGNIKPSGAGFGEYYAYYKPSYPAFSSPSCDKLAKISVNYGPVSTTNYGGGVGDVYEAHEYNSKECISRSSNYSAESISEKIKLPSGQELTANGQKIKRGWVSKD